MYLEKRPPVLYKETSGNGGRDTISYYFQFALMDLCYLEYRFKGTAIEQRAEAFKHFYEFEDGLRKRVEKVNEVSKTAELTIKVIFRINDEEECVNLWSWPLKMEEDYPGAFALEYYVYQQNKIPFDGIPIPIYYPGMGDNNFILPQAKELLDQLKNK